MKITKTSVTHQSEATTCNKSECKAATKYSKTVEYIRCAIDELGKVAKEDIQAREAIANLGVVLLDLN